MRLVGRPRAGVRDGGGQRWLAREGQRQGGHKGYSWAMPATCRVSLETYGVGYVLFGVDAKRGGVYREVV